MENIITTRFQDIKDLPTTKIEVLDASHTKSDYVVVKLSYSVFDQATGQQTTKNITLTKEQVMSYRQSLIDERDRLTARFDNLNAFLAIAGPLVAQWLTDHPQPETPNP